MDCPTVSRVHNSVYVEMSQDDLIPKIKSFSEGIIKSTFTDVVFAFINICAHKKGDMSGFETKEHAPNGDLCQGGYPEVTWNLRRIKKDSMKPYFAEIAKTKKLWISIGAWANDETFYFFKNCKGDNCKTGAKNLKRFMDQYSITGVDVDFESYSVEGFEPLIGYLKNEGVNLWSSAPYSHSVPGQHMDLAMVKANVMGAHWQWCQFKKHGIDPIMKMQYYSGGFVGDMDEINEDIEEQTSTEFMCHGQLMKIPVSNFVGGMGVAGSWKHGDTAGYQCTSHSFEGCQTFMDKLDTRTAGIFTWKIEAVDEYSPIFFKFPSHEQFSRGKPPLHAGGELMKVHHVGRGVAVIKQDTALVKAQFATQTQLSRHNVVEPEQKAQLAKSATQQ